MLKAKGLTYISEDSVYYKISNFSGYGKLSGIQSDAL